MQKVPSTFPLEERMGLDQEARSPCLSARERCAGTSHNGSLAISEAMTGVARYAAVPHEPAHGPMGSCSICCVHFPGRLGPATQLRCAPSAFNNNTEASVPGRCCSMIRHS